MTQLLALDIATTTGFAFYDSDAAQSTIRSGLLRADGKRAEDKAASLAVSVDFLIRQMKPQFVALKEPLRIAHTMTKTETGLLGATECAMLPPAILHGPVLCGAVIALLATQNIAFTTFCPSTWRKHVLGFARKSGWQKADWQKACADTVRALRIPLKTIASAEAVAMVLAIKECQAFKLWQMPEV